MFKTLILLAVIAALALAYVGYKYSNNDKINIEITKPKIEAS